LGKYHLSWHKDDQNERITFRAEVEVKGWIGLGLSTNGGMAEVTSSLPGLKTAVFTSRYRERERE